MHPFAAGLAGVLLAASCASSAPAALDEDPPAPAPAPASVKDEPAPAPKPAEPQPTSEEVLRILAEAAKRQGTQELVASKAPTRFLAEFGTVLIHSEGNRAQTKTTEVFALPEPGSKEARLRSEWVTDAGKPDERRVIVGHNGRFGWMWTTEDGLRRFTDPARDEQDIRDLDDRRRMLRLALRVFFLGSLAHSTVPVTLAPDREAVLPKGHEGDTWKVKCRVLERAASEGDGEPRLRLLLDATTLDPVAIEVPPAKEGESTFLLTVAVIDTKEVRAGRNYPKGVNVPDWLELFEIPAEKGAAPVILIQAGLDALVIDPAKIPDTLFAVPKPK